MTSIVTLLICALTTANLSAQTGCPPYADVITHTIASNEFRNSLGRCPTLTDIVCPLVKSIGQNAFSGCMGLLSVDFPNAESIESSAFSGCLYLQSADFQKAESIGDEAFMNCVSLSSVDFPNAESIGHAAFRNCSSLENVAFPNAVSIGHEAFQFCTSLESVDFPNAESILNYAFADCSSLENVAFPNAESIGQGAFRNCSNLENVAFPNAESIGDEAFRNCSNLESITFGAVPPTFGTNVFTNVPATCKVYVPHNTTDADSADYVDKLVLAGFNVTVERLLPLTYTLTITATNGSVTVDGITYTTTRTIDAGDNVLLESFPNSCYEFAKWTNSNGDSISNVSSLNISIISDTTLTANFALTTHSLSVTNGGNGSVGALGSLTGINCGSSRTITATPDPCYQFVNWTSDNGFSSTDNPLDIVVINDTTLTANFIAVTPRTFSVISGNPAMGTVDYAPSGGVKTGSYPCNTSITATATPVSKYRFIGWYENNVLVSKASPYIFNITSNRTLVGRFEKKPPARIKKINVKKGRLRIKPQP
ncbi:MAG: leucine-rich repeat protein [Bacteroidetes bacterium]|nr:leucine-rich repeat protein [Bacteroidota bacterium]